MVILAFGLVYLFWGSTYLGIDIAVQTIPPALMCALRFSIAGTVMLAVCAATGRKILYSPRQIALAAVVGLLLLMGGNLTLSYAELSVSSGLAALIIAITPLVVSGARFVAARRPSHFRTRQSGPGAGHCGIVRPGLAGVALALRSAIASCGPHSA